MDELMTYLYAGNATFFVKMDEFSTYQIVNAIAQSNLEEARFARALIKRAQRKEPMNFDMEANLLFMSIMVERGNHA